LGLTVSDCASFYLLSTSPARDVRFFSTPDTIPFPQQNLSFLTSLVRTRSLFHLTTSLSVSLWPHALSKLSDGAILSFPPQWWLLNLPLPAEENVPSFRFEHELVAGTEFLSFFREAEWQDSTFVADHCDTPVFLTAANTPVSFSIPLFPSHLIPPGPLSISFFFPGAIDFFDLVEARQSS